MYAASYERRLGATAVAPPAVIQPLPDERRALLIGEFPAATTAIARSALFPAALLRRCRGCSRVSQLVLSSTPPHKITASSSPTN
jgi:hypothetical protein